jgi:histidyl-tRNA synthetase
VIGDAEVISLALDGLIGLGLGPDDIEARINSRSFLAAMLTALGVPPERHGEVYAVIDKRGKLSEVEVRERFLALKLDKQVLERLGRLLACATLAEVSALAADFAGAGHEAPFADLERLFQLLEALGKRDYCRFDVGIVRGLAYYTGPVFEIFDKREHLRALCGGGRYDHLMSAMGAQPMPAVGFGLGDVVLGELLRALGKGPPGDGVVDDHVIALEPERIADAARIAQRLREQGRRADYAMKSINLKKAMSRAADLGAQRVWLVGGQQWREGKVRVRDMSTGEESDLPVDRA